MSTTPQPDSEQECPECHGLGEVMAYAEPFSQSTAAIGTCPACFGTGKFTPIDKPLARIVKAYDVNWPPGSQGKIDQSE